MDEGEDFQVQSAVDHSTVGLTIDWVMGDAADSIGPTTGNRR